MKPLNYGMPVDWLILGVGCLGLYALWHYFPPRKPVERTTSDKSIEKERQASVQAAELARLRAIYAGQKWEGWVDAF